MCCGLLAWCGLALRTGSPWLLRSRGRASARMSARDSRDRAWSSGLDLAILDSRWCDRSCIRVACNVRRICCPSVSPCGCRAVRASPFGLARRSCCGRLVSFHPTYGRAGLVVAGAISSVIPVKRLSRTNLAGRDIPRHHWSRAACCGRRTLGTRPLPGADGTHIVGRLWARSLPGCFDVVLGRELLDRDYFV